MGAGRRGAVADLAELVRIPSVSGDPRHAGDVRRCARWLADRCRRAGLPEVGLLRGDRHPSVLAVRRVPGRPLVLLYAHFDVQPAGDRAAWSTDPFEPVIRDGWLHGRGASDDKGQLLCLVQAAERTRDVGVALLLDGEEEIGSPSLRRHLEKLVPALTPRAAVLADTRMLGPGRPALTVGLRGSLAVELEVTGPSHELHSGQFGGAVHNPAQALAEIIAGLHDAGGRIAVPGLYSRVRPRDPSSPPRSDAEILAEAGVPRGAGERGYSAYERTTSRPALTVNGLTSGHQGKGPASLIPASARAKLSLRLVPDQHPDEAERLLLAHLRRTVPPTVRWRLTRQSSSLPILLDSRDPLHRAADRACRRVWGRPAVAVRSGGSIPLVNLLAQQWRVPTALLGFALPADNAHGPNERFRLDHLELGARTVAHLLHDLGSLSEKRPGTTRAALLRGS